MRTTQIKYYLDQLNTGQTEDYIFKRPLAKNVDLAKVWPVDEGAFKLEDSAYNFFFIKNPDGLYVGAVLDMGELNLHWYVVEPYRKKGYLTNAMKQVIIPYIFYGFERGVQMITIEYGEEDTDYESSKKVAINLGFMPIGKSDTHFELTKENFDWSEEDNSSKLNQLGEDRLELLKKRIEKTYIELQMLSDELITRYENDYDLATLANQVKKYHRRVADLYWEFKREE